MPSSKSAAPTSTNTPTFPNPRPVPGGSPPGTNTAPMNISISERLLHFRTPAGTSRGVYTTRRSWFLRVSDGSAVGPTASAAVSPKRIRPPTE